jgi:hypothetical protein
MFLGAALTVVPGKLEAGKRTARRSLPQNASRRSTGTRKLELQATASSEPGSPGKPNEDGLAIGDGTVAVLDGATARTETGCIDGVACMCSGWRVAAWLTSLLVNSTLDRDLTRMHRLRGHILERAGRSQEPPGKRRGSRLVKLDEQE